MGDRLRLRYGLGGRGLKTRMRTRPASAAAIPRMKSMGEVMGFLVVRRRTGMIRRCPCCCAVVGSG